MHQPVERPSGGVLHSCATTSFMVDERPSGGVSHSCSDSTHDGLCSRTNTTTRDLPRAWKKNEKQRAIHVQYHHLSFTRAVSPKFFKIMDLVVGVIVRVGYEIMQIIEMGARPNERTVHICMDIDY